MTRNPLSVIDHWMYRTFPFLPSFAYVKGFMQDGHKWNFYGIGFVIRRKDP
jgi:hypothetical protein